MGNTIALAKSYVPNLDEIYKLSSLSAVLTSDQGLARPGAKANEIMIPKISMGGLGDYSRSAGYAQGDVDLDWESVKFNFDRGRKFTVDVEDDEETINVAFGRLGAEFMRTKVVPEVDAFTFAKLSEKAGTVAEGTLASGTDVTAAITAANSVMDDAEVPPEGRILFITPTHYNAIEGLQTIESRDMLARFSQIIKVPQARFYTAIQQLDGKTSGEKAGGYIKAANEYTATGDGTTTEFTISAKPAALQAVYVDGSKVTTGWTYTAATGKLVFSSAPANTKAIKAIYNSGADINFLIAHPSAVIKFSKRVVGNVIPPELNSESDGYILKFREYDLVDVLENKVNGVYVHAKAL